MLRMVNLSGINCNVDHMYDVLDEQKGTMSIPQFTFCCTRHSHILIVESITSPANGKGIVELQIILPLYNIT